MINPDLAPYLDKLDAHRAKFPRHAGQGFGRLMLETFALENQQPLPDGIVVSEQLIPFQGGYLRSLVFTPKGVAPKPGVFFVHGGAFMEGSPETHFDITAQIAAQTGAITVSLDYSLTPENPFPAAVIECTQALDWLFEAASRLGIDPDRIAVWGDSAGANLVAVAAQHRRGKSPELVAQVLHYPVLDFEQSRPSYSENPDGPIVTVASMPYVDGIYCPNRKDRDDPRAAPLLAPDLGGLPHTYIGVAEHDPLRDDGYAYAAKLRAADVAVEFHAGKGLVHSYLRAVPFSKSACAAFEESTSWLKGLFFQDKSDALVGSGPITS